MIQASHPTNSLLCVHVSICMYVCMCMCMCLCACVYVCESQDNKYSDMIYRFFIKCFFSVSARK